MSWLLPKLRCRTKLVVLFISWVAWLAIPAVGVTQEPRGAGPARTPRCVLLEAYLEPGESMSDRVLAAAREFVRIRPGMRLVVRELRENPQNQDRLQRIAAHYGFPATSVPVVYGCNRVIHSLTNQTDITAELTRMVQFEVFVRQGCSRCAAARPFLAELRSEYPAFEFVIRDIAIDAAARGKLSELARQHQQGAASTPVFHVCDQMIVGFDRTETTGARIRQLLSRWTNDCPRATTSVLPRTENLSLFTAPEVVGGFPFSEAPQP